MVVRSYQGGGIHEWDCVRGVYVVGRKDVATDGDGGYGKGSVQETSGAVRGKLQAVSW